MSLGFLGGHFTKSSAKEFCNVVHIKLKKIGWYYIVCELQFVAKYQVVNQVYLNNTEEGGLYCIWTQSAIVSFLTLLTKGEWGGRRWN